ncbi:FliH/SctL family protein [Desulfosporosinus sp. OT]|uniref:FliH/SctL family protein n=1 Tax=Desulfosporosinus sp. OT TaxID=913865 RepID=UPI000223B2C1|nr:FliH/SctL family protein [Desulfosporosinus sp. OT]EGW36780.1 flagellar assembly FliH family protein [Desulfosporosinus sp. OT]
MKSFIKGRVVKNYDVEVSTPRMVEWTEGFQQLDAFLTVLTEEVEEQNPAHPEWLDTSAYEEEAQKKVAVILAEAEAGAQAVLAEAESRAQEIHAQAQADLERLRQEVVETAQAEGYRAGFAAGEAEGKRLSENVNKLFQLAQQAVQEEYAKVDEDLLQLALKIAERLVRSSMAIEPQRLVEIIRALTLLPQERLGWRLHVAVEDAGWLEKLPEGSLPPCPWVMDESLNQGDCFLECQEGVFDARLEAQLDKLEHILREELEHGGLESINSDSGTY